ncbi:MAG: flagellar biosynthetic protein FliO [Desulfovibrionaceae bacterium]
MTPAFAATVKNATMALAHNASTAAAMVQGAVSRQGPASLGLGEANATFMHGAGPMEYGWSGYFQAIGSVFLILGIIVFGFWLLRRYGPGGVLGGRKSGQLTLEAHLPLGPKKNVVVVRFLNKRLVLGVTDSHINLLTEMDADNDDPAKHFSDSLEQARDNDAS